MPTIDALDAPSQLEGILAHRPELLAKYRTFYQSFWNDALVPRRTLELCRRRIAYIHDCAAELAVTDADVSLTEAEELALAHAQFDAFAPPEQAALVLAEFMPFSVHQISDSMVSAVAEVLGESGCVSLLTALSFFDVNCRMKLALDIEPQAAALTPTHLV